MLAKKRAKWWVLLLSIIAIGITSRGCFFEGHDHDHDHDRWHDDDHR